MNWHFDDGFGMSADVVLEKFLSLGDTGKGTAGSSDEAAGGFGVAKAVILGTSPVFKWEMHTRDNRVVADGADAEVQIFDAPFRQGTALTIMGVEEKFDLFWDGAVGAYVPLDARLREVLAANDLPELTMVYNGEVVEPLFPRRRGAPVRVDGDWGQGTTAKIKAFRRPDARGAYWVRLGGLFQFKLPAQTDLRADIVIDLVTTVRPGQAGYPLNAARDALQGQARWTFRDLVREVEKENESVGHKQEDEVYEPEDAPAPELAGELEALTGAVLDDPTLAAMLKGAVDDEQALTVLFGGTRCGASSQGPSSGTSPSPADDMDSRTPASSSVSSVSDDVPAADEDSETTTRGAIVRTDLPRDAVLDLREHGNKLPWFPPGYQTAGQLRTFLETAETESPFELTHEALDALNAIEDHNALTVAQLEDLAEAVNDAGKWLADARGVRVDVTPLKAKRRTGNPFGSLAGLRISRIDYDKKKARAFKRSATTKWMPFLALWSAVLKLTASTGGIRPRFKPGFVLQDGVMGMAAKSGGSSVGVIYIHPDRFEETAKANREKPLVIAGFLHGIAVHELTHLDGRLGDGHSENFVSAREDLGRRTVHLLPVFAALATRLLKLPETKDPAQLKLERVERQLEKARASKQVQQREGRKHLNVLQRELEACRHEVHAQAEALSAKARAACTGSCGCQTRSAPEKPSSAAAVYDAVASSLLTAPPPGLKRGYIAGFLGRNRNALITTIERRLGVL